MKIQSVTIGIPCRDLGRSVAWYRRIFDLDRPELEPVEGVVEFKLGPIWLQLGRDTVTRSGAEVVVRFGVEDVAAQHARLATLGVPVGELQRAEDVIEYFTFRDPDGNILSMYAEIES
jgi:catechol 2,3-dioxygenase-like lactoylglutathione lyase family enzyme